MLLRLRENYLKHTQSVPNKNKKKEVSASPCLDGRLSASVVEKNFCTSIYLETAQ
jgi:hypothetical protein